MPLCGPRRIGLPVRVPVEYIVELKRELECSVDDVKAIYGRFRHVAPSGQLTLYQFQDTLGLLGTIGTILAESLFYAFDTNGDGYLDFLEYAHAVLTMLKGSEKRRRELSYCILYTAAYRDAILHLMSRGNRDGLPLGIDLAAFKRVIAGITSTRNILLGEIAVCHSDEFVEKVFGDNASICFDGVPRITQEDFERAVLWSNEFIDIIGAPNVLCAVEASMRCPSTECSSSTSSSRPTSKCGSEDLGVKKSKTYINMTKRYESRCAHTENKASIIRRFSRHATHRRLSRRGLAVYFGHERWDDVINMMVGLGLTARSKHEDITGDPCPDHFKEKKIFSISPSIAVDNMSSLNFVELESGVPTSSGDNSNRVVFTEHAPLVFKRLRALMNLSEEEYIHSVGPEHLVGNMVLGNLSTLSELLSEGRSGALFYFTDNGKLVLKTVTRTCAEFVLQWLPHYYQHLKENPNSLITRFAGLFSMTQYKGKPETTYFIIMNNVFYSSAAIHRRYDLKGSWVGRSVPAQERKDHTVAMKDLDMLDLEEYIELGSERSSAFFDVLQRDVAFLSDSMLMDYSLLLGIHYRSISHDEVDWNKDPDHSQVSCIMGKRRDKLYFVGIIDVLTKWDLRKRAESAWRKLQTMNNQGVSCVPPLQYGERLLAFIKQRTT
ncbi:Phosphatidylinositol-4-phosphate 5-Kinase family protein [Babesia bovis T2Bo]|uniref:1-phosphatidylinositol-4-phosphate 5-kinase, putative n=1 Tax=Babesia bovis TaxID=5865 RepID=A7AUT6_BABBO|nr:Phosphatidylinositol-4-phosphate 5-Kinase family protein [Babesia bovis T2Bo]EDO06697.1 Phosphatidylinositol-4-phosphate 5-Kinase family protein [Babesia bovis T2Bo]|eukprot:XP_001610265.1 1-phosphatidylinositol-4-phosphate 5-kinase [Babesia bovis T2Bo]